MSKIKSEHARSEERVIERQVYENQKENKSQKTGFVYGIELEPPP